MNIKTKSGYSVTYHLLNPDDLVLACEAAELLETLTHKDFTFIFTNYEAFNVYSYTFYDRVILIVVHTSEATGDTLEWIERMFNLKQAA